jgi:hypothetical protein
MKMRTWFEMLLAATLIATCGGPAAEAQQPIPVPQAVPLQQPAPAGPAQNAERQQILESERWRQAVRGFDEWLSVQKLYTPAEVATLRAQFQSRVSRMSPAELRDQLDRMEDKLAVLNSPEAEDARRWLGQFLAVQAKYTDAQLREMRPDVARMTASQIREELARFQQRRGQNQQSQAAFQQGTAMQFQTTQAMQAARRAQNTAQANTGQQGSRAATFAPPTQRSIDLPGYSSPPGFIAPAFTVGPWGNTIRWDPRFDFW